MIQLHTLETRVEDKNTSTICNELFSVFNSRKRLEVDRRVKGKFKIADKFEILKTFGRKSCTSSPITFFDQMKYYFDFIN
jgi:hypothetical protein